MESDPDLDDPGNCYSKAIHSGIKANKGHIDTFPRALP